MQIMLTMIRPQVLSLILCAAFSLGALRSSAAEFLPPGHRPIGPGTHALTGGTVIPQPGRSLTNATLLIRNGLIEAVGQNVDIPTDARIWDMTGSTIYAGFIDAYLSLGSANPPASTTSTEPIAHPSDHLTSGGINFFGIPGQERDPGQRGPGSELTPVTPQHRVAESYSPTPKTLESLRELGFTSGNIVSTRAIFPGTTAFAALSDLNPNETIMKADLFQHVIFSNEFTPSKAYPRSLMGVIATVRQTFFDVNHYLQDTEHYDRHPQSRKRPVYNPALAALIPAVQRKMSVLIEPGSALMIDRAATVARELKLDYHLVSSGEEWRRPDLAKATGATFIVPIHFPELPKMPETDDWDQVTLDQLRAWDWAPENPALLRQQGLNIALTTHGLADKKQFKKNLKLAVDRGLAEADALAALTTVPARLCGLTKTLGTLEPGMVANLTVVQGKSYFDPDSKVSQVWIDGRVYPVRPGDKPNAGEDSKKDTSSTETADKAVDEKKDAASTTPIEKTKTAPLRTQRTANSPLDQNGPLAKPSAVLVKNATLWTSSDKGRLDQTDLLVVDGKIQAVGNNLKLPPKAADTGIVIDGTGRHVSAGLVDAHSHSMILGAVNEGTLPSSAMVRIGDVVNSETVNIRRQLAGGLTVANLLHGSANPIGGQNAIIKLRLGASPEAMKIKEAPQGIKFALGENVKQANWGDENTTRFPQSRMGVPTFMGNRFIAARQYLDQIKTSKASTPPVRRNLELEALGEILEGKRWIHCHSYRQDEILAFLRLMESHDVKVGTLQHVLEGYKVADEIAAHGAGGSCFSDWWAYKFEVYDAIPYAGSLMHERGVLVSFNSDSSDHARRMNFEAAKAVKYGNTEETMALNFVTINPAKQLRIDKRVGSLEPGKDADFVLWSHAPLDSKTVCLQTWIDGNKYFDLSQEPGRMALLTREHQALLSKAKSILKSSPKETKDPTAAEDKFFQTCLEHQFDAVNRHCLDHE